MRARVAALQGAGEFGRVQAPDEGVLDGRGDVGRQLVRALGVRGGQTQPQRGEREGLVADRADPVLGLPRGAALDEDPGVQDVVPG